MPLAGTGDVQRKDGKGQGNVKGKAKVKGHERERGKGNTKGDKGKEKGKGKSKEGKGHATEEEQAKDDPWGGLVLSGFRLQDVSSAESRPTRHRPMVNASSFAAQGENEAAKG